MKKGLDLPQTAADGMWALHEHEEEISNSFFVLKMMIWELSHIDFRIGKVEQLIYILSKIATLEFKIGHRPLSESVLHLGLE
jgi:hypothetical protein